MICMARNKKHMGDESSQNMSTAKPDTATAKPDTIVIDYRGFTGHPQTPSSEPGATRFQAQVPHTRSPLIMFWPEKGREELVINPGVNVLDRAAWEFYSTNERSLMEKNKRGWFRCLDDGLPIDEFEIVNEQNGMIARTVSQVGLSWIAGQAGDREHILDAVERRRPFAHPLMYEPHRWAANSGIDEKIARDQGGNVRASALAM